MSTQTAPKKRRLRRRLLLSIIPGLLLIMVAIAILLMQLDILPRPPRQPAPFPSPAADRDGRWRQDVVYLSSQLGDLHANAFHKVSREAFEKAAADLEAAIPKLNDTQIVVEMMRLAAMIGDGHTRLLVHGSAGFRRFPIHLAWSGEKLFVTEAIQEYEQAIGAELVQIGEQSAQVAYEAIRPLVSYDNQPNLKFNARLLMITPEILYALNILPSPEAGRFTFRAAGGNQFSLDLKPVDPYDDSLTYLNIYTKMDIARPMSQKDPNNFYWYDYVADARAIYFQYNVCDNKESQSFRDFNAEMFSFIDNNPVERLIVDLRYNGGGNSAVLRPFLDEVRKRPALNQKGKLFVLIGAQTFSSALMNALELRQQTNATLLGEPTGGRPNHYGETRQFALPNSALRVQYSTRYWRQLTDSDPETLEPDVMIAPTIDDLMMGRDLVLETALTGSG